MKVVRRRTDANWVIVGPWKMQPIPKVLCLIETTHSYGRGLLQGIARYSRLHGPWTFYREAPFYIHPRQAIQSRISEIRKVKIDGLIIREPLADQVDELVKLGIPMVLSPNLLDPRIPTITTNAEKIGQLAAEHLLDRGFRHFAYCGFTGMPWSLSRCESFVQALGQRNMKVDSFLASVAKLLSPKEKDQARLGAWLQSLPKPLGLMACNDDMGRAVLETCKIAGIPVPEEIAVVGVDDDELTCEMTDPPLSSVALHSEIAGYDAAGLLDSLMRGEKMDGQIISHDPTHVVTRQSTDVIAVEDQGVAKALVYIRQHYREPIGVEEVANEVNLSRRHLYKKFMETLGHSVHEELRKWRIEQICRLLAESDQSIHQITSSFAFTGIDHISRYFRKEKGMSPQEYRRQFRR